MGALHLMVHSLADVVQQARPLGGLHVGAQLGGHQAGNVAYLDGVLQNVLTVAGAVPQAAQHFLQLRVQAPDAGLQHGALALGADGGLHLPPGLFHHLLNMGGMDAAVGNELFQSQPGDLPPDRLEAGDGNGLRCVVDDEIRPGQCLQGADVAALAADDASLHLVIGQGNHTDGDLGHMVGGAALDGGGHDLPAPAVSLVLGPGLDLLDLQGSLVGHLGLHLGDQVILGLVGGEAGDALQHLGLAALDDLDLLVFLVGGGVLGSQRLLLLLDGVHLVIEVFFLLLQAALLLLQVGAPLLHFLLVLAAGLQNLFLGFKKCFSLFVFRALDGFVDDAGGFFLRTGDLFFRHALAIANTEEEKHHGGHGKGGRCYDPTGRCHGWCSSYSFLCMETDGSVLGQIITGRIPCPPDDNLI